MDFYTSNDVFFEQIVKVRFGAVRILLAILTILFAAIAMIIVVVALLEIPAIAFLICCAIGYAAWWSICQFRVEYEYSITNGDFDIDKIVNERKRSRVLSFSCSKIEKIGAYNKEISIPSGAERFFACSEVDATHYLIARTNSGKLVYLIFCPDEKVLEGIRKFLPKQLAFEFFGTVK